MFELKYLAQSLASRSHPAAPSRSRPAAPCGAHAHPRLRTSLAPHASPTLQCRAPSASPKLAHGSELASLGSLRLLLLCSCPVVCCVPWSRRAHVPFRPARPSAHSARPSAPSQRRASPACPNHVCLAHPPNCHALSIPCHVQSPAVPQFAVPGCAVDPLSCHGRHSQGCCVRGCRQEVED